MLRLFLNGEAAAVGIELRHAVAFGVVDTIAEHSRSALPGRRNGIAQHGGETGAVEYVVAQHETYAILADKVAPYQKRLGKPVGRRLLGIAETHAEIRTVAQQAAERRQVGRRGYDKNIAYPGKHESRDGIIYHRLVVDRQQLFADPLGYGVKTRAGASGENDSFHNRLPNYRYKITNKV